MKEKGSIRIIDIISFVIGLSLAVGVKLIFHACAPMEDGHFMNCHKAENAAMVTGSLIAASVIVRYAVKIRSVQTSSFVVQIVLAIITVFIPGVIIRLCGMADMRCRSLMRPAVIILAVFEALAGVAGVLMSLRGSAGKEE